MRPNGWEKAEVSARQVGMLPERTVSEISMKRAASRYPIRGML
jgi:hypothetical protein